ncbi:O-antigen ligase family protein, partial [Patescibacteria group bacterium]|nr:O-antigen ligase family protein [Patescibacteria group bacterium]
PNLYAQYISSIFLVVLYLVFKKKKHKYFLLLPILLFILLNTGSLSVFISFFTTLVIVGISFLRKINLKLISSVLGFLFLIGTGVFFINYPRIMEQVRGGNSNGNIITNDTAKIRFILWSESLKQIDTKTFLIGSGEETFGKNFIRSEIFNQTSEWKQVFNKPHNIFLEYFFEGGIVNFCFLLIVFIYALLRIRKNILYSIPFFIILSSSFLYTSVYSLFLIFLFFKKLSTTSSCYNIKPAYAGKHSNLITKTVFWIGITTAFLVNNIFFISIINFEKNPCLSYKLLNFLPQYQVSCGIFKKDLFIIVKGLESGKGDRILEEKVLIFYLQKNYLKEADKIITNWEKKNKKDPIVIYYRGLYFEKIGFLDKAKIEFKKADELVPNFFAVKEKLNSLSRIKF